MDRHRSSKHPEPSHGWLTAGAVALIAGLWAAAVILAELLYGRNNGN